MDYSSKSDEEIVVLSLQNEKSFVVLIERYQERLTRYARRLANFSKQDIEDVLQEVFIKVYQNLNNFDTSLSFSSWIYRITHNEVISWFRKKKVKAHGNTVDIEDEIFERLASDEEITANLDQKFLQKELRKALDSIDRKYKEVLVLKFLEERSYAEISDILQRPMGSVATLISRAKKQLRKKIEHGA